MFLLFNCDKIKVTMILGGIIMHKEYRDCLGCSNSFSTEENKLICILTDEEVSEDGYCEEYN